jgi:hypothetical protein
MRMTVGEKEKNIIPANKFARIQGRRGKIKPTIYNGKTFLVFVSYLKPQRISIKKD